MNNTKSSATITGRIDSKVHDVSDLQENYDNWDQMDNKEKLEASRSVEPEEEFTVYNVTVTDFHEYFVDNLDPNQTSAKDNVTASHVGLGDDGSTGTTTGDSDLNNRVFSKEVSDHSDNGSSLLCSTFVASSEANGFTLDEIGLYSGDPANLTNDEVFLLNHTTFSSVTKDNTKTVTFDVTLTFSDT